MNKLSKLTALLLAIVLALGVPMQVMAESLDTLPKYEAEVSRLLELLYDNLMASEYYHEVQELTETMVRQDILNFLNRMIAENPDLDITEYDAHIDELFEAYMKTCIIPMSRAYTNVGPFLNYTTSADAQAASYSLLSRGITTTTKTGTTDGMTTTKTVEWDQDANKGTITVEAFSTGATVYKQQTITPPLDIVLIIDQSTSMTQTQNYMPSNIVAETLDTSEDYWFKSGDSWVKMEWCGTCRAWTYGCNHRNYGSGTTGTTVNVDTEGPFYTSVSRKEALIPAVQTFVSNVSAKASGSDKVAGTTDDTHHRIAFVGFNAAAYIYDARGSQTTADKAFISLNSRTGQDTAAAIVRHDGNEGDNTNYLWHNKRSTSTASGLGAAYSILNSSTTPADTDLDGNGTIDDYEKRTSVVILFTDGAPTDNTTTAITHAYNMKNGLKYDGTTVAIGTNAGAKATVYTIGVINDADPKLDFTSSDAPTEQDVNFNKYLHYISSNYPTAKSMGETTYTGAQGYYLAANSASELDSIFRQIADNIETGGSSTKLTEETVVKDVLTDTFKLPEGADSVRVYIADVDDATGTTPTFKDPVLMYGTEADGTTAAVEAYKPTISADGKSISVSGFNFSENWVGTETAANGSVTTRAGGKKLIIEIDIKPVDGFLGGNDVETNVYEDSGIFKDEDAAESGDSVVKLPDPDDVDVNILLLEIRGGDQHIYLSNYADMDALLKSFSTIYWVVTKNEEGEIISREGSYEVDGIKNEYADINFVLEAEGKTIARYFIAAGKDEGIWYVDTNGDGTEEQVTKVQVYQTLVKDTTYSISYDVIPTPKADGTSDVEATEGSLEANVHVYYPTVTFQDSMHVYLSSGLTTEDGAYYAANNYVSTAWSHTYDDGVTVTFTTDNVGTVTGCTVAGADSYTWTAGDTVTYTLGTGEDAVEKNVDMWYNVPTLDFVYSPETTDWQTDGVVTGTECVSVDVTNVWATTSYTIDGMSMPTTADATPYTQSYRITDACTVCGTTENATLKTDVGTHTETVTNEDGSTSDVTVEDSPCEFVIHITDVSGDLIIEKTGLKTGESAIFTATITPPANSGEAVKEYTVVLTGTSADGKTPVSVTLADLLANSTYSVVESGDWSWRYTQTNSSDTSGSIVAAGEVKASFTNSRGDQWLDDEVAVKNDFSVNGSGTVID